MKLNKINFQSIKNILKKFKKFKIHVVGDTIIDEIQNTILIGGQVKTPTLSLLEGKLDKFVGGAAIVASHLAATGAKVFFTTMLGKDENKNFALKNLINYGVKITYFVEPDRPTSTKKVIVSENHRLLKLDRLENTPINSYTINKISKKIKEFKCDAIIFSDFRHGIFNKSSIEKFTKSVSKNVFKVADSQVASRWGNISDFKGFDLITPNEKEARFSVGDQDSTVDRLTQHLYEKSDFKNIILKLGKRGVYAVNKENKDHKGYSIDSFALHPIDPVGAGDALISYATLTMLATNSLLMSSIIGSFAAAIACEKNGNVPVTLEELLKKIDNIELVSSKYHEK